MKECPITIGKLAFGWLFLVGLSSCASPSQQAEGPQQAIYYPNPPDPPRVRFLRSISKGSDIEPSRSGLDTLLFGDQEIEKRVMAPYGVAFHDGKTYICDIQQSSVLTLDFKNQKMDFLKTEGRGILQKPVNLSFAPDGRMFVADLARRQVVVFDENMNYQRELGPFSETSKIVDVAVKNEFLYLVDEGDAIVRVIELDSSKELRSFGTSGDIAHKAPTNISIGDDGTCYVVDTILCQIFVWAPDGEFVRHIGAPGDTVGEFGRPKGIGLDREKLYVIDASFENCQILDLEGEPLMYFSGPGVNPENLFLPAGLWIGEEGLDQFEDLLGSDFVAERLIIIANQFGPHKINFYALGKSKNFNYD
ncbi:MAG: hypothetical protein HQ519_01640 [Planctomycetes bacterium]|nr:hypothetical protein [Planctomycetota bacterium]